MGWISMSERDLKRIGVLSEVRSGRRTVTASRRYGSQIYEQAVFRPSEAKTFVNTGRHVGTDPVKHPPNTEI